jgi:sugar lactone lactonase YvrE
VLSLENLSVALLGEKKISRRTETNRVVVAMLAGETREMFAVAGIVLFLRMWPGLSEELPQLVFPGFSWAENLVFDGLGSMFVSDAVKGELWRLSLCQNGTEYCGEIHYKNSDEIVQFGGLEVSPNGDTLFAGVTFADKSTGLVSLSTSPGQRSAFELITKTKNQPNGLACDWSWGNCYYTDEGTGSEEGGSVTAIHLNSKSETMVRGAIPGADGAWIDPLTKKLYVGELISLKIAIFDLTEETPVFLGEYKGLSGLPTVLHMLDDLTVSSVSPDGEVAKTVLFGADWTGRAIQMFTVDGSEVVEVPVPEGIALYEPTSVRWGRGPGFDSSSIYLTEGGGATPRVSSRRVIQIKMKPTE